MENVALWHERDISHSSAERMIGPDATVTLDFALVRLAGLIEKLFDLSRQHAEEPRPPRRRWCIAAAPDRADQKGASREDAYKYVQRNAMPVCARRRRFPDAAQERS